MMISSNEAQSLKCRVCRSASKWVRTGKVLSHQISYFDCDQCGYFQTEEPYWLEEAYSRAINDVDVGILVRNQANVDRVLTTIRVLGIEAGRVVDHAGGYGVLVRLLRDRGVDAWWSDKYCENLLARGFEAGEGKFDLLTAFEVFEHLENPLEELRQMLSRAPHVLVSTDLVRADQSPGENWWYLGPEHGQHIGFFRRRTLEFMASTLDCHVSSDGHGIHLFSKRPIPDRWYWLIRLGNRFPWMRPTSRLPSRTQADFEGLRKSANISDSDAERA